MAYTVGELARHTGVTVRTLHHYDELGLVKPSARSGAGYRLYDDRDLLRLQHALRLRELGFQLHEIAEMLADPDFDRAAALREQRTQLLARRDHLDRLIAAVDAALTSLEKDQPMPTDTIQTLFADIDPAAHADEARARWGDTPEYAESARRTRGYGPADWAAIKAEADALYRDLAALLHAGTAPGSPAAQAAIEAHRQHISRWFYPCTRAIHRQLGAMYIADPRFSKTIDRHAPGLAQYLCDATAAAPADP
jgi:DNA-binding transcriptional MerR regulator